MSSKLSPKKTATVSVAARKAEVDFWKKSILFFIFVGVILFIMSISTSLVERQSSGNNLAYELNKLFSNPVYIVFIAVLLAASVVWAVYTRLIRKKDESLSYFSSINALLVMLYISGFSAFFGIKLVNSTEDCSFVLALTVAIAVVYYVSKMYHPDFLVYTVETFILAFLLYRYWHVYTVAGIVGKALIIVAFAAVGFVFGSALKKYTSRAVNNKKITALFYPYWISLAIFAVFMFIKVHNPASVAVINLAAMLTILLAQYIVFAIVYTIRLIRE